MSEPVSIPEWIVALVGRLLLENEAMRQTLAQQAPPPPDVPAEP